MNQFSLWNFRAEISTFNYYSIKQAATSKSDNLRLILASYLTLESKLQASKKSTMSISSARTRPSCSRSMILSGLNLWKSAWIRWSDGGLESKTARRQDVKSSMLMVAVIRNSKKVSISVNKKTANIPFLEPGRTYIKQSLVFPHPFSLLTVW